MQKKALDDAHRALVYLENTMRPRSSLPPSLHPAALPLPAFPTAPRLLPSLPHLLFIAICEVCIVCESRVRRESSMKELGCANEIDLRRSN